MAAKTQRAAHSREGPISAALRAASVIQIKQRVRCTAGTAYNLMWELQGGGNRVLHQHVVDNPTSSRLDVSQEWTHEAHVPKPTAVQDLLTSIVCTWDFCINPCTLLRLCVSWLSVYVFCTLQSLRSISPGWWHRCNSPSQFTAYV